MTQPQDPPQAPPQDPPQGQPQDGLHNQPQNEPQNEPHEGRAGALFADAVFARSWPKLDAPQAAALAARAFGISGDATLLTSERDQNFRIDGPDNAAYVLKITHPAEDAGVTDFHTQAQLHLMRADATLPIPRLIATRDGQSVYWRGLGSGSDGSAPTRQAVRLITFVPGVPLYKVARSAAQRRALGTALARIDLALHGFTHAHASHRLLWDLQHLAQLRPLLACIEDPARQSLVRRYLDRFEARVAPVLPTLRRQVIHNDLNPYNVLVDAEDHDRVAAVFDFGDMVEAPLVNEIAVAAAYQLADAPDPLVTAAECIGAYHARLPLTDTEIALLPDLIAARLMTTVLITSWRAREHPENSAYILRNSGLSWSGLERLDALGMDQAVRSLQHALQQALPMSQHHSHQQVEDIHE
ncbi:phosphotransferase [Cupriavidus plantarum]|uniref:phosphotransferase n=1 Tax=Cupriavidus plantarum TaxID=942865 RepID=UPI001B2AFB6B|nr:phosphotransferase [Cupriavidus plantarum]CAG2137650.1 Homoserine kinase [Cupriavidus plantarum]SMR84952.1 Ser/Thr protein kinase RdoA involved in Cpx stress response, MazF antagonist [Cupriavidus plantarum]